jgi:tetratricopeptide (TPR) repeat protein
MAIDVQRRWSWRTSLFALVATASAALVFAAPYVPPDDAQVLAVLPAGARHTNEHTREVMRNRLDIALPLAQFNISRSRATGDLRYLGYAEAILAPWLARTPADPTVLVLHATILQSRHAFGASLVELDQALRMRPADAQAWLTRSTVLRVLGRYDEALESCQHLAATADAAIVTLCEDGLLGLTGHLQAAYDAVAALSGGAMPPEARAWRCSELGEMAERLGNDVAAEHYFQEGLAIAAEDFYMRAAYADLLLRQGRPAQTLQLLGGYESMEPMLLRIAIAHRMLRDGADSSSRALLANAFQMEQQRGDAVHRREQARFFLDVEPNPGAALAAAVENWQVQREPDDALILLRAASAAGQAAAGRPARLFLQREHLQDVRLAVLQ